MSKKISFFTVSKSGADSRYLCAFASITLFLIPNLVFLIPGLYGVYITYLAWFLSAIILVPLVNHRGLGSLDARDALNAALILVILFTILGFLLGFYHKRSSPQSLSIDMVLLMVKVFAAEVARTSIMAITSNRALKLAIGTMFGFFFGYTVFSSRFSDLLTPYGGSFSNILGSVPQIVYNILVAGIHVLGGLYPALVFRLITDGYWRLSPYTPNTSSLGIISPIILSLIYLFAIILIPGYERIRGSSDTIFRRPIKRVKKIASIAVDISIFTVIILLIYSLYADIVPLVVISGSMEPTIGMGDIALIARIRSSSEVRVGDIIAFWYENQVVIHRVVSVTENGFITKGDSSPSPDPFIVERGLVIGKAVGSIPKIGWITIIMRSSPEGLRNIVSHIYSAIYSYSYSLLLALAILVTIMVFIIYRLGYIGSDKKPW